MPLRSTRVFHYVDRFAGRIASGGVVLSACCIFVMMVATIVDIVSTQILKAPVMLAYELVSMSLVGAVWLAVAQAQLAERHIVLTFVLARLPETLRRLARCISYWLALLIAAGLVWVFYPALVKSYLTKEAVPTGIPIPVFPSRVLFFIGVIGFLLVCITQVLRITLRGVNGKEVPGSESNKLAGET
ncbi:MAG: TRAP transporter small permease [Chloroflexi bacterium]|nr:TRAP transporter small permease [Chloroflexota bacterium]